ncbi:MAG: hypothetical protein HZT40_18035 [Candidatus Thiothrix singaporensis]|uniref:Uncharacterized protein n=1 Tax=Candidatus Thiothrix singaporensis TaxID=2799669 RepID=A0A7L6AVZ9_9GAMM|nr:MAG: hypothetical protein HZT40_18035 [Candidatus Thiothrix singaporensis]
MKQVIPYLTGAVLAFMLLALMAADSDNAEAAGKKNTPEAAKVVRP